MRSYGLIGKPLTHSFSKRYFSEKFERESILDASYELFEIDSVDQLPLLLQ
jgi:shikimate dehydrogenase